MSIQCTKSVAPLPFGFSHIGWEDTKRILFDCLTISFPLDASTFNYGSSTPTAANRVFPWFRLNPDGTQDRWYVFLNGAWISPHPIPPASAGGGVIQMWSGDLTSLKTFDGGADVPVTDLAGPFWECVTAMEGRSPMGVGLIGGAGGTTTLALAGTTGEEKHTLLQAELPDADCVMTPVAGESGHSVGRGFLQLYNTGIGDVPYGYTGAGASTEMKYTLGGSDDPHNNVHPVYGVYFIQRTARKYYYQPAV